MARGALLTGAAGGIIGAVTAGLGAIWGVINVLLIINLNRLINDMWYYGIVFPPQAWLELLFQPTGIGFLFFWFSLILGVLLTVSCILIGVGFYGIYEAGGEAMGIAGFIIGIIGGILVGTFIILGGVLSGIPGSMPALVQLNFMWAIQSFYTYGMFWGALIAPYLFWVGMIAMGIPFIVQPNYLVIWGGMMILAGAFVPLGVASIFVRDTTARPRVATAAGVLSILGACFFFLSYPALEVGGVLALAGFGLIFVAFILWAVVFYQWETY